VYSPTWNAPRSSSSVATALHSRTKFAFDVP
jgi:hypothetical protein